MAVLELEPFDILTASPARLMSLAPFWMNIATFGATAVRLLMITDTLNREDAVTGFNSVAVPAAELPPAMRMYRQYYESHLNESVKMTRYMRVFLIMDSKLEDVTLARLISGYGIGVRRLDERGVPLPFVAAESKWDVAIDGATGIHWGAIQSRNRQNGVIYPQTMHRLFSLEFPVWISLDFYNYGSSEAMSMIRQKREAARAAWADKDASSDEKEQADIVTAALHSFNDEMNNSGAALHEMQMSIIVGARGDADLNERLNIVRGASGLDLRSHRAPAKVMADVFNPKPKAPKSGALLTSFGAAVLSGSCLSYKRPTEMNGVLLGFDNNQAPIVANLFDRRHPAYNMTVIGQTGAGKTFFMLLLMLRHLLIGTRLVIIDPKGDIDFSFLGQDLMGQELCNIIRAGTDEATINVLSVSYDEISTQVQFTSSILTMLGVQASGDTLESAMIDNVLMRLYRPLWDEERGQWRANLQETEMPTLPMMQYELEQLAAEGEADVRVKATLLAYKLRPYVHGSRAKLFGQQTTVDYSLSAPVTIFDVSKFPSRQTGGSLRTALSASLFALINQSIVKRRAAGDRVPIQFMIDEIGVQMRDPIIADYTSDKFKTARSLDVSMIVADQTVGSLVGTADSFGVQHGNEMLANSPFRFIFFQPDSEMVNIQQYFPGMPAAYRERIHTVGRGYCIAQTPHGVFQLRVVPSEFERIVLSSRPEDRRRARALIQTMRNEA